MTTSSTSKLNSIFHRIAPLWLLLRVGVGSVISVARVVQLTSIKVNHGCDVTSSTNIILELSSCVRINCNSSFKWRSREHDYEMFLQGWRSLRVHSWINTMFNESVGVVRLLCTYTQHVESRLRIIRSTEKKPKQLLSWPHWSFCIGRNPTLAVWKMRRARLLIISSRVLSLSLLTPTIIDCEEHFPTAHIALFIVAFVINTFMELSDN